jgi:hypothetical protein
MEKDLNGNNYWYNSNNQLHRKDGPAIEYAIGTKEWWVNGMRHRLDGPAVEYADGTKAWWVNGELHREDGPAAEWVNGAKEWYLNGERHRLDGPAVEYANGTKEWYLNGKEYPEEKFLRIIQTGFADSFSSIIQKEDLDPTAVYEINGVYYRLRKTNKIIK